MDQQKYKTENKILRLSLGGTITFTVFEIIASFVLGSKTVMTDGIFDLFDLLLLLPMFILVPFLYKPVSEKKPYGFSQIESLLVLVKYIVLLIVVINMITNNITVLLHGGHTVDATNVLIYEASLCVCCIIMYLVLHYLSRNDSSMIIKSELYLWKVDIVSTLGISVAFLFQIFLTHSPINFIIPYIDSSVAIIVALFLVKEPIVQIIKNLKELVLFSPDQQIMDEIRDFLLSPQEYLDTFWESDVLIWIDWREYDESIIKYINEKLPEEDKVKFTCVEIEKERDVDIILEKNGISTAIPYAEEYTDRDTTLKSLQEYVSPKYQIRWFMGSLGSDTLAFCIYPSAQWEQLEEEFGAEKVAYYFAPIKENSVMFEMGMDEVFNLLEQRGEA